MSANRTGVILINLGTPDGPDPRSVRRYLAEFLMDPLVIDIPAPLRWALVHGLILPRRPAQSARAYAQVWTDRGSPLLCHSNDLTDKVRGILGSEYAVELGMRYGSPSIASAVERIAAQGCRSVVAIPLFPQYSLAATESAALAFRRAAERLIPGVPFRIVRDFYSDPRFLNAFEIICRREIETKRPDHVLFSFHGLPERHVKKTGRPHEHCLASESCCAAITEFNRDCYRAQSYATAHALAARVGITQPGYSVSFQSRLGRTPWIRPYTDHLYDELPQKGIRRLMVVSPSFVADCLETLEEIAIRGREQFVAAGGEELWLAPSLNSADAWAQAVADFAKFPPALFP